MCEASASQCSGSYQCYFLTKQKLRKKKEKMNPGFHKVVWDGKDDNDKPVSSGIYFHKLKAGRYTETKKMILLNNGG